MTTTNLFTNNAASVLASGITAVATSLSVTTGTGSLFPAPAALQQYSATLVSIATGFVEIVLVSARISDTFTVTRAQGGTTALAFSAGDRVELRLTAGNATYFDAKTNPADLAASSGATLVGVIATTTGAVARTVASKLNDNKTPNDRGALTDGASDDYAALQNSATDGDMMLNKGTSLISTGLSFTQPVYLRGRGPKSVIAISTTFPAASDLFTLSPATGVEKRNWGFERFQVTNAGTNARDVFLIDLTTAGKYLSKLTIKGIVSDQVTNKFVELLNPTNLDGLFSCVFEDNWSMNGYYLSNVGDSVVLQRNIVSGIGVAFYISQLATASHVILRDNNLTSAGGALSSDSSINLTFEENQVEVTPTFTGANNAAVGLSGATAISHFNPRFTHNNINCQSNATLTCVSIDWALNAQIDDNSLYCNPTTGSHIVVGSGCQDTYIGINRYFSSADGSLITQRITDNGLGTKGIWKDAALATWTDTDTTNEALTGFFKERDDVVSLRGRLNGASSTVGQVLFTLPVRFRPAKVVILFVSNGSAQVGLQILPTGTVELLTAGVFSISLNAITFSTQ